MNKLLFFLSLSLLTIPAEAQFKAKMYFTSMGNNPVAAYKYYQDQGLIKVEGQESINGIACTRSGLWNRDNPDQKMFTVWISDTYNMPVKMINHIDGSSGGSVRELKEVEPWTPEPGYLEVPDGYQVMGMPDMMP